MTSIQSSRPVADCRTCHISFVTFLSRRDPKLSNAAKHGLCLFRIRHPRPRWYTWEQTPLPHYSWLPQARHERRGLQTSYDQGLGSDDAGFDGEIWSEAVDHGELLALLHAASPTSLPFTIRHGAAHSNVTASPFLRHPTLCFLTDG